MSTFWTPSGEHPIGPPPAAPQTGPPPGQSGRPPGRDGGPPGRDGGPPGRDGLGPDGLAGPGGPGGEAPTEEEMAAQMAAMQEQVQKTPGEVLVGNHCMGFFEIAALYLSTDPPRLADARLAVDAFAAIVDSLGPRLGQAEAPMRDALAQLRLGYLEAGG